VSLVIAFLLIALGAQLVISQSLPPGPWHGFYETFKWAWLTIGLAGMLLVIASGHHHIRIFGGSLMMLSIGLMTLQWGTLFTIRDGWNHIRYMNQGVYLGENPYPAFHLLIETIGSITGMGRFTLLNYFPLVVTGTIPVFIAALAKKNIKESAGALSVAAIGLIGIARIEFYERPFTMVPVIFLLTLLALLENPHSSHRGIVPLTIASIAAAIWHPTSLLSLILFVVFAFFVYHTSMSGILGTISAADIYKAQKWANAKIAVFLFILFVVYILSVTEVGVRIFAGFLTELLTSSGESASGGVADPKDSAPIVFRAFNHITEVLIRAADVLLLAMLSLVGIFISQAFNQRRLIAAAAVSSSIALIGFFTILDIFSVAGFSILRSLLLASLLLLPGAICGIIELYRRTPRGTVIVSALVLLLGLGMMFPSPWLGTFQPASTPSDIDRTAWLVSHHGDDPVIDAENTYEITIALYGENTGKSLATGDLYNYRRLTRDVSRPWEVPPSDSGGLYVIHGITRTRAEYNDADGLATFVKTSNHIYASGNSDVYWIESELSYNQTS